MPAGWVLWMVAVAAQAAALDVPITVEETAGVARAGEPVIFGVPLPRGQLKDLARLRLGEAPESL